METLHASAVAFDGRAVLILGASGSGKSTLALELIALGGTLVSDDRTVVRVRNGALWLDAPAALKGRIEARGLGILATVSAPAIARVAVDLNQVETARLPEPHVVNVAGVDLPCLRKVESPAFPAMVRLYLSGGRQE